MILAFFGLWETTLAIAAAGASIPIIIHLLNRKRFRIVVWAAMKFLLAAQKQNTRRMRVEQLILLAVRTTLVLLIVLAMASVMPWAERVWGAIWPGGGAIIKTQAGRTFKVIVLDGSLSMNLVDGGKTSFERARQMAARMVKDSPAGDGFSVLLLKDTPTWIVAEPSYDARRVAREIEELRPVHGNASGPATLGMIASKLGEAATRFSTREVYFFTDMQRATWVSAREKSARDRSALEEIQKKAQTVFVDVGRDDAANIAVSNLTLETSLVTVGAPVQINATIHNFGKEPRKNVRVELLVGKARHDGGDQVFTQRVVDQKLAEVIAPGTQTVISFVHIFGTPGSFAVQVRIESDDLDLDDVRTVIVPVRETVPVLVVNGKPAVERYERATEYLRLALNPFPPNAAPRWAPLRPKEISATQFADLPETEFGDYDCIYLCDVAQFGPADLRRLDMHVRRGGGLIISLGDRASEQLDTYNRFLFKNGQGLLPAQLLKKITAPAEHVFSFAATDDAYHEFPLKAFAGDDDRISLRGARFRQYIQAKSVGERGKARTILSFMPELQAGATVPADLTLPVNEPAVIEWNPAGAKRQAKGDESQQTPLRYRGKVVLVTTTLNMDWTTWPGSPSFGALIQELTRFALSGRLREHAATVGQPLEEVIAGTGGEVDVHLTFPSGSGLPAKKLRTELIDEVNLFRWLDTDVSGIYTASFGNAAQQYLFAVNVPSTTPDQSGSESDLARVDKAALKDAFGDWDIQVVNDPKSATHATGSDEAETVQERARIGPGVARFCLLLVLILVFVEIILAWRFGHFSTALGATEPPREGAFWPWTIGLLAGAVFVAGGYVLINASETGDFLGFLPDTARASIESLFGIPEPASGEGRRWNLESLPRPVPFLPESVSFPWLAAGIAIAALVLLFFIYQTDGPTVRPAYRGLLAGLRLGLILLTLAVLMPQLQLRFDRQGRPDIAIILDDSRSMGEPDHFQDEQVRERAKELTETIRKKLKESLPERIKVLQAELAGQKDKAKSESDMLGENLADKLIGMQTLLTEVNSPSWRPSRLQLVQAILDQSAPDWLDHLVGKKRMKVRLFHLDQAGRAIRLHDGEIADEGDTEGLTKTRKAIANLEPEANESRLGHALRQVLDHYRGSPLSAVIMFTDGVTTRDETIAQTSEYAAQKGVPLFFVGIGDDHDIRDLKLHDLQVEDTVYVNDKIIFKAFLTGQGYKDLTVPIVLKMREASEKEGKEKEISRKLVKVDPQGKSVKFDFVHQPTEVGQKLYIIEVEPPKLERNEKTLPARNLRLERTIEVLDTKLIRVLYVEGTARYEYRFIKSLLEREKLDQKKRKSIDLRVVLLDADQQFPETDRTALSEFPSTRQELEQYDVIIVGDCNPKHGKLGDPKLRLIADFVRGDDGKGNKSARSGGGLLMIAGPHYAPHAFKDTPLADVLPIEPLSKTPPEPDDRMEKFRVELTPIGRQHSIFSFNANDHENVLIWQRLAPMYWWSTGYRLKPLAEVLAVHPQQKAASRQPGQDGRQPLAVQQFVGSGRTMFFGFDETWRWRFREDEIYFNNFWIQTMRHLARHEINRTLLRLDRQTPYRAGEPIKVTVKFPDTGSTPGFDPKAKGDVKVIVQYWPRGKEGRGEEVEVNAIQLARVEGSRSTYEGPFARTREGRYKFTLSNPDVSKQQPGGQKPNAEASVELPPGELDRLRMNQQEMTQAADATHGQFYNLANANNLLGDLPPGVRVSLSTTQPPFLIWNHAAVFGLILFLLTAEWLLRKRKHLL